MKSDPADAFKPLSEADLKALVACEGSKDHFFRLGGSLGGAQAVMDVGRKRVAGETGYYSHRTGWREYREGNIFQIGRKALLG
jgi:hypothetical protein